MTLKEAGEIYTTQSQKIDEVKRNLKILDEILDEKEGPLGYPSVVEIRRDILVNVQEQLIDLYKHLEYVMEKEI